MKRLLALISTAAMATYSLAGIADTVVERTGHGIVHVTASTYKGIGFGVGHAYAEDNRCLLAYRIAQVNGRLAEQVGADKIERILAESHSMQSQLMDALFRTYYDGKAIREGFKKEPQSVRDLAEGYAAGVNDYLKGQPQLAPCERVNFTGKVTVDDIYRLWVAAAGLAGAEFVGPFLAISEQTPSKTKAAAANPNAFAAAAKADRHIGSNALAIGRDGVSEGGPLHLYNPHFPWAGIQRTYVVHARIPGELDVMGPMLGGFPLPVSGFNQTMVWGLTFSNTQRVTLMEIKPLAKDPTRYLVDGKMHKITTKSIPVKVAGEAKPRIINVQMTQEGPIMLASALGLPDPGTFIVTDVNRNNTRLVNQWLGVAKAKNVKEVKASLDAVKGVPWSYTTAVDAQGDILFGEISAVPNIPAALYQSCSNSPSAANIQSFIGAIALDGTRSACYPKGTLAAELLPSVMRSDYLANSNNNFEVPNAHVQLAGGSMVFGPPKAPLQLRPSLGLKMVEDRLAGTDHFGPAKFTAKSLKQVFDDKRNYAAEMLVTDIAALCKATPSVTLEGASVDITSVCNALTAWDRKNNLSSRGAHVFGGLWTALHDQGLTSEQLLATPPVFDKPLATPSPGLSKDEKVRSAVLAALAKVAKALQTAGIAADAPWGDVHFVTDKNGKKVGVPGGPANQGIYDAMFSLDMQNFDTWLTSLKGLSISSLTGSSYSHLVELTPKGPEAKGILAFSQATEKTSPWYLDQLTMFSAGEMFKFPFTAAEIEADLKSRQVFK